MLRELQAITPGKHAPTTYKAAEDMKAGMLVTLNDVDGTAEIPADETITDLYWVTKERIPTGLNAARADISDYDEEFINIKEGELVKVVPIYTAERYATDQFDEALAVGDKVTAVAGKATKATGSALLKCVGDFNDNGHALKIIVKVDPAV